MLARCLGYLEGGIHNGYMEAIQLVYLGVWMKAIYCETHGRFEMMTWDSTKAIALNEDIEEEHHFSDPTHQYVHAGKEKDCKLCK